MSEQQVQTSSYTRKDFVSDQEIKWCPGCGDYAILASLQQALATSGKKKEDIVCVSGIGCSSRLPYYVNSFGFHTIHGRALAISTGMKVANPNLSLWVITGDGDCLSIGGNHFIHAVRRNVDLNILLFNNQIYGLTKGQFSPTSGIGKVTKSSPYGSVDRVFRPAALALGAGCTFIAKTMDTDPKGMTDIMLQADQHRGSSFVEVYQNCVIFNDKTHDLYTNRATRDDNAIFLEHGKPMIFGKDKNKGIMLKNLKLEVVAIGGSVKESELLVHDKHNSTLAHMLIEHSHPPDFPMVMGILYQNSEPTYEQLYWEQLNKVMQKTGKQTVKEIILSDETWEVT